MDAKEHGTVTVTPERAVAGQRGTWRVVYTVGSEGMAVGGSLRIRPPQRGMVRWDVGQVIAEASRPGAVCQVRLINCWPLTFHWRQAPIIHVDVWGEALQEGDTITVTIGHRGGYSRGFFRRARAQEHAQDDAIWDFWVDTEGNKCVPAESAHNDPYVQLEPFVMVVAAGRPSRLSVVARQPGDENTTTRVIVAARDRYDNLCSDYAGRVRLEVGDETLTVDVTGGRGSAKAPVQPGAQYLSACDPENELIGLSNPVFPRFSRGDTMPEELGGDFPAAGPIFFGDLHVMTGSGVIASALRDTRAAYEWARDVAGLDFCAITNGTGLWEEDLPIDDEFYEPGEFVTIPAYETYFRIGHKNVYFPDTNHAKPPPDTSGVEAMLESLRGRQCLVIPHHTNVYSESSRRTFWTEHDFSTHDPLLERLIEISQDRGSFEREEVGGNVYFGGRGSSVWSALQRGMKLGFVGGTDTHRGQPGEVRSPLAGLDPEEDLAVGGLTAVIAPQLTRQGVWEALWHRRCYATQGQRTLLNFAMDNYPLGTIVPPDQAKKFAQSRTFRFRVQGHRPVVAIELVRSDGRVFDLTGGAEPGRATITDQFTDEQPLDQLPLAGGAVFYYLRVTEEDGRMAWSSPIWLQVEADE